MSEEKKSPVDPQAELLPPRELMSRIDPSAAGGAVPGASGLLGGTTAAPAPDPSQAAAPTHGLTDDALHQAQTTPGTTDPHVESSATS
jgi:hypothetical protein